MKVCELGLYPRQHILVHSKVQDVPAKMLEGVDMIYSDPPIDYSTEWLSRFSVEKLCLWRAECAYLEDCFLVHWDCPEINTAAWVKPKPSFDIIKLPFEWKEPNEKAVLEDGTLVTHPSEQPIELVEIFLKEMKPTFVCDPFAGSGTTLIACERMGIKCLAIECDPVLVDIILKRYEKERATNHTTKHQ